MKFYEVAEDWKKHKEIYVKKSTFSAYVLLIENHLLPKFRNATYISEKDIQDMVLEKLKNGLSQKTVKDIIIVLKMVLKYGDKHKLFKYEPFEVIYPTRHEKTDVEVLSKADHKKIIDYVKEHFTFRNLGVLICLSTGLRIGEVCALTWNDIDTDNGLIHVRKTIQRIYMIQDGIRKTELIIDDPKTKNSNRSVPMSKTLLSVLKPFKKIVNNDFYVLTNEEKPTEPRSYRSYYKNLMNDLKMPDLKFHGLRHSFATRCIESKADVKTVSVLLGHSNISTTLNLYVHPNEEQKRSVINSVFKGM